ncbi:MAG: transposase [Candidatus Lokiarchaeota archaeon]|nr:transposase [Candidatus Lokiarchaeota archaeon]
MEKEDENSVFLGQKIRIFPDPDQKEVLWDLAEKTRKIYNMGLDERRKNYEEIKDLPKKEKRKRKLTVNKQIKKLPQFKEENPEYKWVYSQVYQQALKRLNQDYNSFFNKRKNGDETARPPGFRSGRYKNNFFTMRYPQVNSGVYFRNNQIQLTHKHPKKDVKLHFDMRSAHREKKIGGYNYILDPFINDPQIIEVKKDKKDWFFICLTYKFETPPFEDNGKVNAFDLGVSNLVAGVNTNLETMIIKNRRADLYWKRRTEGKPPKKPNPKYAKKPDNNPTEKADDKSKKKQKRKRKKFGIMFMRDHCFGANRGKKNKNKKENQKKKEKTNKEVKKNNQRKRKENLESDYINISYLFNPQLDPKRKSRKYKKYDKKRARMQHKMSCQMKDYQHQIAYFLTHYCQESILVIGDLSVKEMAKHKPGTGKSLLNAKNETKNHSSHNSGSLGRFSRLLADKSKQVGKRIVKVDEYNTTKKCCICGKLKKRDTDERTIICNTCKSNMDRDLNGGVNILFEYLDHRIFYANIREGDLRRSEQEKLKLKERKQGNKKSTSNKKEQDRSKLLYPFIRKQPSMDEVSCKEKWGRLRQTALSSCKSGDRGFAVIPKRFKNGKTNQLESKKLIQEV